MFNHLKRPFQVREDLTFPSKPYRRLAMACALGEVARSKSKFRLFYLVNVISITSDPSSTRRDRIIASIVFPIIDRVNGFRSTVFELTLITMSLNSFIFHLHHGVTTNKPMSHEHNEITMALRTKAVARRSISASQFSFRLCTSTYANSAPMTLASAAALPVTKDQFSRPVTPRSNQNSLPNR